MEAREVTEPRPQSAQPSVPIGVDSTLGQCAGGTRVAADRRASDGPLTPAARPRVFVVSDICLFREGIVSGLSRARTVEVVGATEAANAPAAVAALCPDVALLDAGLAGGLALPRLLKRLVPGIRTVAMAIPDDDASILAWAEAGSAGYVGREGSTADLIAAIHLSVSGELACPPRLAALLFNRVGELAPRVAPGANSATLLTPREREVMALVEQGLPNKEIAQRLSIGHATVKNHVHHVLEKLQARGRGAAVARLRREEASEPVPGKTQRHPRDK